MTAFASPGYHRRPAYSQQPTFRVIGQICRRNATYEDAVNEFIVRFGRKEYVEFLLARYPEWHAQYG